MEGKRGRISGGRNWERVSVGEKGKGQGWEKVEGFVVGKWDKGGVGKGEGLVLGRQGQG